MDTIDNLTDLKKATLWKQRFFEAQAACEEYISNKHGDEGVSDWIDMNSSITARLLHCQQPDENHKLQHMAQRFLNQLLCYDSKLSYEIENNSSSSHLTIENIECGILKYRKDAEKKGVKLTFKSPCHYCMTLNKKIMKKYIEGISVEVALNSKGCLWKISK